MIKVAALLVMSFVIASDSLAMLPTEAQSNKAGKSRIDISAMPLPPQSEYNSPVKKKRVVLSDISKQPPPFQAAVTTPPRKKVLQFPKTDDLELPNDIMQSVDSPVRKVPLKIVHEKISMDEIFEQAVYSLKYEKFKNNISDSQRQLLHDEVARIYEAETKQKLAYNELSEDALRLKTLVEAFFTKPQIARQRFLSSGNISEEGEDLPISENSLTPKLDSAPGASSRKVLSSAAKSIQRPQVSVVGLKAPHPIISGHKIITPTVIPTRLIAPPKLRQLVLGEMVNAKILAPQTEKARSISPSAMRNEVGNQEIPSGHIKFSKDVVHVQLLEPSLLVDPLVHDENGVIKTPNMGVERVKAAAGIIPSHVKLEDHPISVPDRTLHGLMKASAIQEDVSVDVGKNKIIAPNVFEAEHISPSPICGLIGDGVISQELAYTKASQIRMLSHAAIIDPVNDLGGKVIGKPQIAEAQLKAPTHIQGPIFYDESSVIKTPNLEDLRTKAPSALIPINMISSPQPISALDGVEHKLKEASYIQPILDHSVRIVPENLVYGKKVRTQMLSHAGIRYPVLDLASRVIEKPEIVESRPKFPALLRETVFQHSAYKISPPIIERTKIKQASRFLEGDLALPVGQIIKPLIDEVEVLRPSVIREIDQNIPVQPIRFSGGEGVPETIKSAEIQEPLVSVESKAIEYPIVEGARPKQPVAITPPNIEPSAKQITVPNRVRVEVIAPSNIQPMIVDQNIPVQPIGFSGEEGGIEITKSVEIQKPIINTKPEVIKTPEVEDYVHKKSAGLLEPDMLLAAQPIAKPNVTTAKLMTASPIREVVIVPEDAGKQPIQFAGAACQSQLLQPSVVQALIEPAPIKKDVAMAHNHIPIQTISIQQSVEEDSEQRSSDSTGFSTEGLVPPTVGQHMAEPFSPMNILLATQNNRNLTIQKYKDLIVDQSIKMVLSEVDVFMLPLEARLDSSELRVGAAAGDEKLNKNLWFRSFASASKRNINIDNLILNKKHTGFIVGVDTELTDNLLCGLAYMRSSSKTKLSNISDNTQDTHLHMVAFYSECAVGSRVKLHSYLKYGWSDIQLKDSQNINIDSIKGNILSARSSYNIMQNYHADVTLVSKIGCSIDQFKIYPTSNIPYKQGDKLTLNLALAMKKKFTFKDYQIIPEFGFGVDYLLAENNPEFLFSSLFKNKSSSSISRLFSSDKMLYNAGILLYILNHDKYELSFAYNMSFAKNLMRHFGSLSIIIKL